MEEQWWQKSVVYQIYPKSFNDTTGNGQGDLKGITEKLPYLKKLGVDVIWLTPIYASPQKDNGYDISDYYAIHQEYGSMEDFEELLEQAHRHGLKLIMDMVVNHSSTAHQWFHQGDGHPGGIAGDPAPAPLLGHIGCGAGAACGVQYQVAGVGGH